MVMRATLMHQWWLANESRCGELPDHFFLSTSTAITAPPNTPIKAPASDDPSITGKSNEAPGGTSAI